MTPTQSFGDKVLSHFMVLFPILAIVAFLAKVKQGWSLLEWLRVEGIALVFSAAAALVWAIMDED
jgi:cation transport ATPase